MSKPRHYKVRSETPHDFSTDPLCEGVIVKRDVLEVDDKEREFIVVDTGETLAQVFHSHALDDAFKQGEIGDGIRIRFHGKKRLKSGKSFNRFSVQVWEGGDLEEIASSKEE